MACFHLSVISLAILGCTFAHAAVIGQHNVAVGSRAAGGVYRISAFNIKTFGASKMSKPDLAAIIRDIVLRYDVILIQEIRDISQDSIYLLLNMVNSFEPFDVVCSNRLGRTSYKEQYCYYYRTDRLQYIDQHQFDDGVDDGSDVYEREPFSVRFRPVGFQASDGWDFALVGLHAKPDDAVAEIKSLVDVFDNLIRTWSGLKNIILMGDFNADCTYAKESELQSHIIYEQTMFKWVLGFNVDTTTSTNTNCAYDRLVVVGSDLQAAVIPGSEDIFRFEDVYNLNYETMIAVSDHYPVEMEVYIV